MTTWTDVSDATNTWNVAIGYVFVGYVSPDTYVLSYAESPSSGSWTNQSNSTNTWVQQ